MADIAKFVDWALTLDGTNTPFTQGSLEVGNDAVTDRIKSGGALTDDLIQVLFKQPMIRATLLDPSAVTDWGEISSGVVAVWRAYEQNGGLGSTYKTFTAAGGVLFPVALTGSVERAATLQVQALATFTAGTGIAVGTATTAGASVTKAFYPTSLTLGGGAITALTDINVNWEFNIQHNHQNEPAYYYYDTSTMRGTAQVKDLDEVTAARLEDLTEETVVALFTDANNGSNTVSTNLGTCKIQASIQGDMAQLQFEKVA